MDTVVKQVKKNYHSNIGTTDNRIKGSLEEQQETILKTFPLLELESFHLTENDDCVEDFIHNFLVDYKNKYYTLNTETNERVCRPRRHRTLIDMFLIARFYFPEATLLETIKGLYYLHEGDNLDSSVCSTIYRRVYECRLHRNSWGEAHNDLRDEFGYDIKDYLNFYNNN